MDFLERYVGWMKDRIPDLGGIRYAVDCSNGMASLLAREIFQGAVLLNDSLDGRFPVHSPNPLDPAARERISAAVRDGMLDCGVIFDGDADRAMFVDERGEFVQSDYLIPVVARSFGEKGKVIHDIRTSRGAIETLREDGCEPVMVPVGHAFAKPILRETGAFCGGELAGHYYFRDFHGCDSGVFAALRILGEIARAKRNGETFSVMMSPICSRYANSGEINFKVDDKDAAIARVLEAARGFGTEIARSEIDGIRLEFADGWINVRKSNTEPYLRLIAEFRERDTLVWREALLKAAVNAR